MTFNLFYCLLTIIGITLNVINSFTINLVPIKISEYDQEIPQSQTADNPMAPRGRATQRFNMTSSQVRVILAYKYMFLVLTWATWHLRNFLNMI